MLRAVVTDRRPPDGGTAERKGSREMTGVQLPVAALTVLGILLVVLGLFAPVFELVILGLVSIGFAGLLALLAMRRT
jgi:hypothetical protein